MMNRLKSFSVKMTFVLAGMLTVTSCMNKVAEFENPQPEKPKGTPNTFDFSTTQKVKLSVDYSAEKVYGAVFFSVYSENPLNVEVAEDGYETWTRKENVSPVYENYTDQNGKFNQIIELPSYASHLYVLTSNFTLQNQLIEVDVKNNEAVVTAASSAASRRATRAGEGVSTNDLTPLWNISFMDNNWTKGDRVYPDWATPLGTWNSMSGRPDYVNKDVSAGLSFSESELADIYDAATRALNVNKQCSDEMITQADLELVKDSEVGITMIGGATCWHSTMGYYYYTDEVPTKDNLHIIMLFPNTQDGHWNHDNGQDVYNGNIGVQRGDVVQLMYYPNIASGSLEGATKMFPKGTKLGFILKTNGWGMQKDINGKKFYLDRNWANRRYNSWNAATDGLSYFVRGNTPGIHYDNPTGASRTAKFQCKTTEGHTYAIISFEDAYDDKNYSDVVFALKPMDAFQKLPDPEDKVSETKGVYCFEDLWPSKGDYDLNDAMIAFKHSKTLRKLGSGNSEFKMVKETISLTTYQNYVTLKSGLAMTFDSSLTPSKVVMKTVKDGNEKEVTFTKEDNVYLITDNIKGEIGTEYVLEFYYDNGVSESQAATVKPFIYRDLDNGKRLEIHIVGEAPTSKMDTSYFGKDDDLSDPSKGLYYVRASDYPFAFFLNNATIDDLQEMLKRENESKSIDKLFPGYLDWATSKGAKNAQWYKKQ